jgi:hypothetical protein
VGAAATFLPARFPEHGFEFMEPAEAERLCFPTPRKCCSMCFRSAWRQQLTATQLPLSPARADEFANRPYTAPVGSRPPGRCRRARLARGPGARRSDICRCAGPGRDRGRSPPDELADAVMAAAKEQADAVAGPNGLPLHLKISAVSVCSGRPLGGGDREPRPAAEHHWLRRNLFPVT